MAYQQGIPFASGSHTSYQAAVALRKEGKRGEKMRRLIDAYRAAGERGLTDLEAAEKCSLPLQSVCSLRNAAVDCELVTKGEIRIGKYGKPNQAWRSAR
jgi:hypothetical protein